MIVKFLEIVAESLGLRITKLKKWNDHVETDYLKAVKRDGWVLQYIPTSEKTWEICLAAVQQTGCALWAVPEDMRTREMCLAAVRQDGNALHYVPADQKTPEMCLAAVSGSKKTRKVKKCNRKVKKSN